MVRVPKQDNKFIFEDKRIEALPLSQSQTTPRYYDLQFPKLMLRINRSEKVFYLNYTDPVTHTPQREYVATWGDVVESTNTRGTKKIAPITVDQVRQAALEAQARIKADINVGKSPVLAKQQQAVADARELAKGISLREAWFNYLSTHPRLTEPTSVDIYQTFRHHLIDVLDKPIIDFCIPRWIEARFVLIYERQSPGGHGGSPAMAYKMLAYLKAILNHADADGVLLGKNPVSVAERTLNKRIQYQKPKRKKVIIPAGERHNLHAALLQREYHEDFLAADFVKVLLYTGIRDGAARTLRFEHYNPERGFIWIYVDTQLDRMIVLPLSDQAISVLNARIERLKQHDDWDGIRKAGWLFCSKYNGQWSYIKETKGFFKRLDAPTSTPLLVSDKWRRPVLNEAGIPTPVTHPETGQIIYKTASPHDFRRMVATYAKNHAGIAANYIDKMLTHSSETLLDGYIVDEDDIQIGEMRQCFNQLAEFIDAEKAVSIDKMESLLNNYRMTQSSLPGKRAPTTPVVRNKHTPKTKPTHKTTSHP